MAGLVSPAARSQMDPGPGQDDPSLSGKIFGARVQTSTSGLLAYGGYNVQDAEAFIGGGYRVLVPVELPVALLAQPTVDVHFAGDGPLEPGSDVVLSLQVDLNLLAEIPTPPSWLGAYVGAGAGLSYARTSGSSFGGSKGDAQIGVNVLAAGHLNPDGRLQPFLAAHYGSRGAFDDTLRLSAGLMLSL